MKTTFMVTAVVLAVLAAGLGYMGLFSPVKVEERDVGPYEFIYVQEETTDFGKIGELTEALGQRLEQAGFTDRRPAQVYYPTGRGIQNQIGFVVDRAATREVLNIDTFYRLISAQRCMTARFPYRNPLSFVLGHLRVEPAFRSYREAKGYAQTHATVILENDHILYLQPIEGG